MKTSIFERNIANYNTKHAPLYVEISSSMLDAARGLCSDRIIEELCESLPYYETSFNTISNELKTEYPDTLIHCVRTAYSTSHLCHFCELNENECTEVCLSALLHDIGKIYIPTSILDKPAKLDADEFRIMQQHPIFGARILTNCGAPENIVRGVAEHHEHWNGMGYCSGLSGDDISFPARIISLCDAVDAMYMGRPYKESMDTEYVIHEVERCAGSQFDPDLSEVLLQHFDEIYDIDNSQPLF